MGKRIWSRIVMGLCLAVIMVAGSLGIVCGAEAVLMPTASDNLEAVLRPTSRLAVTDDGYMRVFYDGKKVRIEYYDDSFNLLSKKELDMELPYWGGFYAGSDGYYLVEGQSNTDESNGAEVIRVIKYDWNWNRLGAASVTPNPELFGGDVRYPFDHGTLEVAEYNGKLYVVTGHQGYVDDAVGQGHQGFLMIEIDTRALTGQIVDCDLWHSFAQYIEEKDGSLYVLEQSEGSRCTYLSKKNPGTMETTGFPVLPYGGSRTSAWAVACYASVDGMAVSDSHVFGLGTSIDQSQYDTLTEDTAHNLYLTVTPRDNFTKEATTVKWLTNFTGNGAGFVGTKITEIHDNRFMISWEVEGESAKGTADDTLSVYKHHYIFVDGAGNQISGEYTADAPISDCQPVVKDGNVIYYASNGNMVNFYMIDGTTGAFSKKCYRVAGEHATWDLKDGTLTLRGDGPVTVNIEANYRSALSTTASWNSYSSGDNCWKPVRDQVKSIVFKAGLTSIPDEAFCYFDGLTEVTIESGMTSIGTKAFYECDNLSKIIIPATVTSLGEDFLWSGYYSTFDDRHLVYAEIHAPKGSFAAKYAAENDIRTVDPEADEEDQKDDVTGGDANTESQNGAFSVGCPKTLNVRLAKGDYDSIYASWSAVKVKDMTVKYKVQYRYGSGKWKTAAKATTKKNWTLKNLQDGRKVTVRVAAFVVRNGNTCPGKAKTSKSIYTLKKLSQPVVKKAAKNKVKVSWKNISGETGYEIYRSAKKTKGFKLAKRVKGTKIKAAVFKTTKGKTLYYKVRAYKNVKIGKKTCKVYGPWSKVRAYKLK